VLSTRYISAIPPGKTAAICPLQKFSENILLLQDGYQNHAIICLIIGKRKTIFAPDPHTFFPGKISRNIDADRSCPIGKTE